MAVYVGPPFPCCPNANWRWRHAAHLYADTPWELDGFALLIGLRSAWCQARGTYKAHYDLTERKRGEALTAGAVEHTQREEVAFMRARREAAQPKEDSR